MSRPSFLAGLIAFLMVLISGANVFAQFNSPVPFAPGPQFSPYQPAPKVNQKRGATLGGLAGAVVGGLIGDHNGEAGAGAAIGGVVGAVTGGALGNAADQEQAWVQQRRAAWEQQQQVQVQQNSVSAQDVVSLSRSGLSENVIISQIQRRGVTAPLQVADIIALHKQGVSERIITAMQQAPLATSRAAAPAPRSAVQHRNIITHQPVIIEEHVVVPHYYAPSRVYHRRGYHHGGHPRAGFHIRF